MHWRPLSVRDDPERSAEYDALHAGLPEWLVGPISQWISDYFEALERYLGPEAAMRVIERIEQMLRMPLPRSDMYPESPLTPGRSRTSFAVGRRSTSWTPYCA